jgi:hypothetical protein
LPIPTWVSGQVLTASDVNTWFVPLNVIKPSSQGVTSSTALVNDTALVLAVAANSTYWVDAIIEYNGVNGADIKCTFTIPAGASGFYGATYTATASGNFSGGAAFAWTDTNTAQANGTGTPMNLRITGILVIAGTAGNLQFRWAQNVSNGTATTVMPNSAMRAQRIGP